MENGNNKPILPECSQGVISQELEPPVYKPNLFSHMGSRISEFFHDHEKGIVEFWMFGLSALGFLGVGATYNLEDGTILRNVGIYGSIIVGSSFYWIMALATTAALIFDE